MKKATGLVTIILIGLIISSCDKKNALLVNRRTVTPEIIEEIKEAQKAKEERSTVTPLNSKQISEQTKEKESESGPKESLESVSITKQESNPTENSEPTKEEEPKQESKDSVVIQPQHQLPPSVLAQASVTGSVVSVDDNDSSSVPAVQSEASSAQEQTPKLVIEPSLVSASNPNEPGFIAESVGYVPPAEPEPVVVAEPEQEPEQASELLPTPKAIEANTECNGFEELSNQDETIKTELEHKVHENLGKSLEEKDKEEIERSKAEKKEIDERCESKLKAEKEDRIANLKEQGAQKRAQRAILKTEAERKTCEYEGLEELFDEGKTVVEAEEIRENGERINVEKQMEEAEQQQRDRFNKEEQKRAAEFKAMQKAEEEQRRLTEFEAMQKAEEEQKARLIAQKKEAEERDEQIREFAAMQKAEEEQKTRLKEWDRIWTEFLAEYADQDLVNYYAEHPALAQEQADRLYKREQEKKQRIEESNRELEKLKRETDKAKREADKAKREADKAKREADEAKRHREETDREIDRLNEIIREQAERELNLAKVKEHSKYSVSIMSVRQ